MVTAEPLHAASLVDLAARRLRAEILSEASWRPASGSSKSSSPAGSALPAPR
jgi:hypothetical protein